MSSIVIQNLRKEFGNFTAIDGLNLQVSKGDFCVFLGPSGCGKSTTLNCIAGLEEVTSGKIFIGDRDVTNLPPHERDIAMVFQSSLLYPHLTAKKNIMTSVIHSKDKADVVQQRFENAVRILEINHLLDKKPSEMSGGERQRIAMAKVIVRNPVCFLMDEPLAALDASLRQSLRTELTRLQKDLGVTTVFVTHDQVEAMTMGDKIMVMNKGKLEQYGTPLEIYENPKSKFVAGFVGSPKMNFFPGELERKSDEFVFNGTGYSLLLKSFMPERIGDDFTGIRSMGIRPENMRISSEEGPNTLAMKVYNVENLGKESIVILVRDKRQYRIIVSAETKVQIDEVLNISIDGKFAHFFREA